MRGSGYWLPWEKHTTIIDGAPANQLCDGSSRAAIDLLASRVSNDSSKTKAQAAEALYRTIGWLCTDFSGGDGR